MTQRLADDFKAIRQAILAKKIPLGTKVKYDTTSGGFNYEKLLDTEAIHQEFLERIDSGDVTNVRVQCAGQS
jgi:hypothetical protein